MLTNEYNAKASVEVLKKRFPNGISEDKYMQLIALLYEDFSDRNLSELISEFTNKDIHIVYNDVLKVASNIEFYKQNAEEFFKEKLL